MANLPRQCGGLPAFGRASKTLAGALVFMVLSGCATDMSVLRLTAFTEANIDKLYVGMPSTEVREMFGAANEVRTATCGAATGSTWVCETWTYGSNSKNSFTFNVSRGVKVLNNWNVKRD